MIPDLPGCISLVFGIALVATLLLFDRAIRSSLVVPAAGKSFAVLLWLEVGWLVLQGALALWPVYSENLEKSPPMLFRLGLLPALLVIAGVFFTRRGRAFVDRLSLQRLTLVSLVRIPVELALFGLYLQGSVPQLMTFEGGNLDILSGLSAPLVVWLVFRKEERIHRKLLLSWNVVCLGLLVNIVSRALLSAPFPFQKLAFEQPNVAILSFPYIWLPTFIVPVVLFSHLASLRQLMRSERAMVVTPAVA